MKKSILLTTLSLVPMVGAFAQERPNVLFIAVDDLNDYISPLKGYVKCHTPNLERLAKMGITFTNANTAVSCSAPSRVATMTGVSPHRSGNMANTWYDGPEWRNIPVLADVETLEERFKNNGYRSMAAGKIYHTVQWNDHCSQIDPTTWDEYYLSTKAPIPKWERAEYDKDEWVSKPPIKYFVTKPLDITDEQSSDNVVAKWTCGKLQENYDQPFFLACGFFRPHIPWEVPQKYFDMYPLESLTLPVHLEDDLKDGFSHGREHWHKWVEKNDAWLRFLQGYLASITYMDTQLGLVLDALESSQYRDNTIVMMWADHGMHIGEKENWEKFTVYEESAHIPMFLSVPGGPKGVVWDKPVSSLDIYPTLMELAGLSTPEVCDGVSLVPIVEGKKRFDRDDRPVITYFEYPKAVGQIDGKNIVGTTVRDEKYRYMIYSTGFEELYDHTLDPHEFTNIAADNPKICKKMRAILAQEFKSLDAKDAKR